MSGGARESTQKATEAATKGALRAQVRARRRQRLSRADHERRRADEGAALAGAVFGLLEFEVAPTVAAYEALPTEPPTAELLNGLSARGVRVLIPVLLPDKDLAWRDLHGAAAELSEADLVIVPALAVDADGTRLGQGGGSYDRALPRRRPGVPVVALLFDDEWRENEGRVQTDDYLQTGGAQPPQEGNPPLQLPREAHDAQVDAVVTPSTGIRWINGPGVAP